MEGINPKVLIIVLTWNQCQLTLDCLNSLFQSNYPNYHVIVVDNGSQDGTTEAISLQYPLTTVIKNKANLGFAEGNNVGIRHALNLRADYVFLLNNDTVVERDMISRLIWVAESDSRIGVVSPKIYYYSEPSKIWCAGARIDWRTGATARLQAEEEDVHFDDAKLVNVDFVSGCAFCVKRGVIERIGLLDPRFFIYYEETDWSVRASKAGYWNVYVPTAHIWHKVSSAMKIDSPITAYYMNRNVFLFLSKSLPMRLAMPAILRQLKGQLRTIAALSFRQKYRVRNAERNARILALLDFTFGRYGKRSLPIS